MSGALAAWTAIGFAVVLCLSAFIYFHISAKRVDLAWANASSFSADASSEADAEAEELEYDLRQAFLRALENADDTSSVTTGARNEGMDDPAADDMRGEILLGLSPGQSLAVSAEAAGLLRTQGGLATGSELTVTRRKNPLDQ